MDIYILIGGIGSGKSTVMRMLAAKGAACVDLDVVGHAVLESGWATPALVDAFGEDILNTDGLVVRKVLAARAFRNAESTAILNAIMHPLIVESTEPMLAAFEQQGTQIAVVEISAYAGPDGAFDGLVSQARGIVALAAPRELRAQRAVKEGFLPRDVRARIARQPSERDRTQWATRVIPNVRTPDALQEQVDALWVWMAEQGFNVSTHVSNREGI